MSVVHSKSGVFPKPAVLMLIYTVYIAECGFALGKLVSIHGMKITLSLESICGLSSTESESCFIFCQLPYRCVVIQLAVSFEVYPDIRCIYMQARGSKIRRYESWMLDSDAIASNEDTRTA